MKRLTNKEFIEKARKVHGDKYDYSKVEYINKNTKVCIICPIHGEFCQTPDNHFKGQNCPKCANVTRGDTFRDGKDEFIRRAREVHGDKYDYSKVDYINNRTKVCIICPIHGEFWQVPYSHLKGFGCKKCNEKVYDLSTFVNTAKEIHGDEYDYSKVIYKSRKEKVCIICPKHGEFWQRPNDHLNKKGCPICKQSKIENEMETFLMTNNFVFERQKRFNWLGLQSLDFYLSDYNIAIECQGGQHFKNVEWFGGKNAYKYRKQLDKNKKELCKEHNVKILYYTHEDYDSFLGEQLIKSTDKLLEEINRKKEYKPEEEETKE